jgi:hypothetical protein
MLGDISMPIQRFQAKLIRPQGIGTWTYFTVPFDVEEVFGSKNQVKVKGKVSGAAYRSSLMPSGDGTHYMVVNKTIRDQIGVGTGDVVTVEMELDSLTRDVEVPDDVQAALDRSDDAKAQFDNLSYSHRKAYIDWITAAKKEETRTNRIGSAIERLRNGERLKG